MMEHRLLFPLILFALSSILMISVQLLLFIEIYIRMPLSSKKLRARERREKKAANKREKEQSAVAATQSQSARETALEAAAAEFKADLSSMFSFAFSSVHLNGCTHGFSLTFSPKDLVIFEVFDFFYDAITDLNQSRAVISHTRIKFWDVIDNKEQRSRLESFLLSMGTKHLYDEIYGLATIIALFALDLEHWYALRESLRNGNDQTKDYQIYLKRLRDLLTVRGKRNVTKFFAKRIPCNCLKELYDKEVKGQPRMGMCFNCKKEKEYMALQRCSRCNIAHYCNRKCQVENWPNHKQILCKVREEGIPID